MARPAAKLSPAEIITNSIIAKLEAGVRPWVRPWRSVGGGRPLRITGAPYRGINCVWLWMAADSCGYSSQTWMTYKQASALGAQVCEGERAQIAIFYKAYTKTVASPVTGESGDELRRVLRAYSVFNADQIDGLPEQFHPARLAVVPPADALPPRAQEFIARLPARLRHQGSRAYYDRIDDSITMPPVDVFNSRAGWAATLAHEAGHWTGHPDRLNRTFGKKFGDQAYAFEELCAEICSSLLGADLGLPTEHLDNHAAYIDSWLTVLKRDPRAILTAAAKAEAAAAYLLRAAGMDAQEESAGDMAAAA